MSRETSAGVATVTQLCSAFGISRAAYYAAKKPRPAAKVVALRKAPTHTSSEVALEAIREVLKAELRLPRSRGHRGYAVSAFKRQSDSVSFGLL